MEFSHMVQWRGGALRSVALWVVEAPRQVVALLQKAARQVLPPCRTAISTHASRQACSPAWPAGIEEGPPPVAALLQKGARQVLPAALASCRIHSAAAQPPPAGSTYSLSQQLQCGSRRMSSRRHCCAGGRGGV